MNRKQLEELILQSLEHEVGGVQIYTTAITCALNKDLKKEWEKYLAETRTHVTTLEQVCKGLGIDAKKETPGRQVVRHNGKALVEAMQMALKAGDPTGAQLVACEVVVLAETKDHANWTLIGKCAQHAESSDADVLQKAYDQIEDQEDDHLYHSRGWCRELWVQSLGIDAMLPPPEEKQKVKTAMSAARAEAMAEMGRQAVLQQGR